MTQEIRLELLIGKRVLNLKGKPNWRIQEVRAEQQGDEWAVVEYLIGPAAILERLSAWKLLQVLPLLKTSQLSSGYRVPWDKLDLTDPEKPQLLCAEEELKKL